MVIKSAEVAQANIIPLKDIIEQHKLYQKALEYTIKYCPICKGEGFTMEKTGVVDPGSRIEEEVPEPCFCHEARQALEGSVTTCAIHETYSQESGSC